MSELQRTWRSNHQPINNVYQAAGSEGDAVRLRPTTVASDGQVRVRDAVCVNNRGGPTSTIRNERDPIRCGCRHPPRCPPLSQPPPPSFPRTLLQQAPHRWCGGGHGRGGRRHLLLRTPPAAATAAAASSRALHDRRRRRRHRRLCCPRPPPGAQTRCGGFARCGVCVEMALGFMEDVTAWRAAQAHANAHRCSCCSSLPNTGMPVGDRLRVFSDYAASYDTRLRNPRWVLEHISAATLQSGGGNRKNSSFVEDAGRRPLHAGRSKKGHVDRRRWEGGSADRFPPAYYLQIVSCCQLQASSAASAQSSATTAALAMIEGTWPPLPTTRAASGPWTTHSPSPTRALRQAGMRLRESTAVQRPARPVLMPMRL